MSVSSRSVGKEQVSTGRRMGRRKVGMASAGALLGLIAVAAGSPLANAATPTTDGGTAHSFIVQAPTEAAAAAAVKEAGGTVVNDLGIIGAVEARLGSSALAVLSTNTTVRVTADVTLRAVGNSYSAGSPAPQLAEMDLGANWSANAGAGVGVALIDTGVTTTAGISASHVVRSPDFAGDGNVNDEYGHGTFMAGLIIGNGQGGTGAVSGVAPGATVVSVKVAGADGTTSLGQVLEGIAWAVDNRVQYNIRVMSISFGAVLGIAPDQNPLDAAVEMAWASGITVVAAAGNNGAGQVTSPGDDPWVITAGAETTTGPLAAEPWSGSSQTKPDVFTPGQSVVSLRDPGSTIDTAYPSARIGANYFVGSGTSMATALTAGAVAILAQDHPAATPDDLKGAIVAGEISPHLLGHAGPIDVVHADQATPIRSWWQSHQIAFNGLGSGVVTMPWTTAAWTTAAWTTAAWTTAAWTTAAWTDRNWS